MRGGDFARLTQREGQMGREQVEVISRDIRGRDRLS
jgi:hypothetical protein